jgi:hypothetical protein
MMELKAHVNLETQFSDEENARARLCMAAVKGVLDQYRCEILSVPFIGPDGRVQSETHVIPKR